MANCGSVTQTHQSNKYGPLPLQLWKATITIATATTGITVTAPNKMSGTAVAAWIDPTTLTASATIKVYDSTNDGLTTPLYAVDYTVPTTAIESRNILTRRVRIVGTVTCVVASATAGDSFVLYLYVDPNADNFSINYPVVKTVTIANNGTTSTACDCEGLVPVALVTAASLTGTSFTYQCSHDESTYTALYDEQGTAVSTTVASSRWTSLGDQYQYFTGVRSFKIVSGSTETGGDTITVILRPLL